MPKPVMLTRFLVLTSPTSVERPLNANLSVEIPRQILDTQLHAVLVADVMFVTGVPFLVSSSRNINLITIEHVPHCTASKLGSLLQ